MKTKCKTCFIHQPCIYEKKCFKYKDAPNRILDSRPYWNIGGYRDGDWKPYKPENDMTIEELCKESKKQRREDRRKGYLKAVKELKEWAYNEVSHYRVYELLEQKLKWMEGK